jgi:hypothetical protein
MMIFFLYFTGFLISGMTSSSRHAGYRVSNYSIRFVATAVTISVLCALESSIATAVHEPTASSTVAATTTGSSSTDITAQGDIHVNDD